MRLYYNGRTIEDLKKYLGRHSMHKRGQKPNIGNFRESRRESLGGAITSLKESLDRNYLEEKDKEDEEAMKRFYGRGEFEEGGYEYEKQKRENKERNEVGDYEYQMTMLQNDNQEFSG